MKFIFFLLFISIFNCFYSQSEFEKRWNNPDYEQYIELADKAFKNLNINDAHLYYSKAFKIRETNYALENSLITKAVLSKDKDIRTNIIEVADSCIAAYNECAGQRLLLLLKPDERIEQSLHKIHHPIHCNNVDHIYYTLVNKGDKFFEQKEYSKAKTAYERALYFNKNEDYPKNQLIKIETILKTEKKF